jgi:serine/threonine-protein kinase
MAPNSNPGFLAHQAQQNQQPKPNDLPGFGPPPGMAAMMSQAQPYGSQPFQPMSMPSGQVQQNPGHQNPMGNQGYGAYPNNGPQSPRGGPSGTMPPHGPLLPGQHPSHQGRMPPPPPSQIETALSLPRPDSVAGGPIPPNRSDSLSTIVLVAVAVLTAICVLALGALIYFKRKVPPAGGALEVPSLVGPRSDGDHPPDRFG